MSSEMRSRIVIIKLSQVMTRNVNYIIVLYTSSIAWETLDVGFNLHSPL